MAQRWTDLQAGAGPPRFTLPAFPVPAFTLEPLAPGFGVGTPSARGLFPWEPSAFVRSQQGTWGPAENLAPPPPLAAERSAQRRAGRARSFANFLAAQEPETEVSPDVLAEVQGLFPGLSLPAGAVRVGDLLGWMGVR